MLAGEKFLPLAQEDNVLTASELTGVFYRRSVSPELPTPSLLVRTTGSLQVSSAANAYREIALPIEPVTLGAGQECLTFTPNPKGINYVATD